MQVVGANTKTGTRYAGLLDSEEMESREGAMDFLAGVLVGDRNAKNQAVFQAVAKGTKEKEWWRPAKNPAVGCGLCNLRRLQRPTQRL